MIDRVWVVAIGYDHEGYGEPGVLKFGEPGEAYLTEGAAQAAAAEYNAEQVRCLAERQAQYPSAFGLPGSPDRPSQRAEVFALSIKG